MPKIVIVEDDQAIAQMYRIKFEVLGYDVYAAENGKIGLEVIKKTNPDLVLLDLMLPEMNGIEMLQRLRQEPWGKQIKVVILTNLGDNESEAQVKELQVERYIVKAQYTPREVAEVVKEVLAK